MLEKISSVSTDFFLNNKIIPLRKKNIIKYGFMITYSTLFCFISILAVGKIFNRFIQALIFLIFFIVLRIFAGGYHAKTYAGCFCVTNIAYLIECLIAEALIRQTYLQWIIFVICTVSLWIKAPAKNPYRKLDFKKTDKSKTHLKQSLVICCLLMMIFQRQKWEWIISEIAATIFIVTWMFFINEYKTKGELK